MPPHIAQLILGHKDINTTMGYKAVYPEEAINGHRAFIARRRELRPSEEYRTPTDEEWEEFLGHFERRKRRPRRLRARIRLQLHPRAQLLNRNDLELGCGPSRTPGVTHCHIRMLAARESRACRRVGAVHAVSGSRALAHRKAKSLSGQPGRLISLSSCRPPGDEDELTSRPVRSVPDLLDVQIGCGQRVSEFVAAPEPQRGVRGQRRAVGCQARRSSGRRLGFPRPSSGLSTSRQGRRPG